MSQTKTGPFTLPALPYEQNALQPAISSGTINYHYGQHHQGYVNKLNKLVLGTELEDLTLEEIIVQTTGRSEKISIFNNAAQVWNHTFYWNSLSPNGGGKASGELHRKIETSFGSYEKLIKEFAEAGMEQFGSGWAWLVKEGDALKIIKTPNAENPLSQKKGTALLTLDVWEHAYYLDYQNKRNDYLETVLNKLINWEFASKNLAA